MTIAYNFIDVNNINDCCYDFAGGDVMDTETKFSARIPSADYARLRVVAAMRGESINLTLCDAVDAYLLKWEEEHGEIPTIRK
jgi:hypothetical protein